MWDERRIQLELALNKLPYLAATHVQSTIQRHRMIHAALADEFAQGLHALSLKTKTAEESQKTNK